MNKPNFTQQDMFAAMDAVWAMDRVETMDIGPSECRLVFQPEEDAEIRYYCFFNSVGMTYITQQEGRMTETESRTWEDLEETAAEQAKME